jgi:hypothetical protein
VTLVAACHNAVQRRETKLKQEKLTMFLSFDLNTLGEWAVENKIEINTDKSKPASFTKAGGEGMNMVLFWGIN